MVNRLESARLFGPAIAACAALALVSACNQNPTDCLGGCGNGFSANYGYTGGVGSQNNVPLAIANVSPKVGGPMGFDAMLTISGSGFAPGATVTIGSGQCTGEGGGPAVVLSPTEIQCLPPSGPVGPANVSVTNPDGLQSTLVGGYTFQTTHVAAFEVSGGTLTGDLETFDNAGSFDGINGTGEWSSDSSGSASADLCAPAILSLNSPSGTFLLVAGGSPNDSCGNGATNASLTYMTSIGWQSTGSLNFGRNQMGAAVLPNGYGFVVGGCTAGCTGADSQGDTPYSAVGPGGAELAQTAEIFDPQTQQWSVLSSALNVGRSNSPATFALPDGEILVCGGSNGGGGAAYYTDCELFDGSGWEETNNPMAGIAGPLGYSIGSMSSPAAVLNNSQVMMYQNPTDSFPLALEIWDPTSELWSPMNPMPAFPNRSGATLTKLANGSVLLAGGADLTACTAGSGSAGFVSQLEIYSPSSTATGSWAQPATALLQTPRFGHSATLLPNGTVLISGGCAATMSTSCTCASVTPNAEIFDPTTMTSTTVQSMPAALQSFTQFAF